jgi:threonylcarbamoyladenosine tRNA methylthiotransferase MtaB
MGRDSRISEYRDIIAFLRDKSPEAAIGADIIVGFPGEMDEDFRATEDFLRESALAYFHVFSFSPRPGTPAFGLDPVEETIIKERGAFLRKISKQKNAAFRKSFIGRILEGVVIKKGDKAAEILTTNYVDVHVPACSAAEGEAVKVMIVGASDGKTAGEVVD